MKTTHMAVVSALVLALVVLGGCSSGVKVIFANNTARPVNIAYHSGGLEGPFEVQREIKNLDPGKTAKAYLKYDDEAIESERRLSVTVDGGTMTSTNALIPIAAKPYTPKKLTVTIVDIPDIGHVITVFDDKGQTLKTK